MAQPEIVKFLRGKPDQEFTSKEISVGIDLPLNTVNSNLRKIRKDETILYRVQPKGKGGYLYKYDRFNEVLVDMYENLNVDKLINTALNLDFKDYNNIEEILTTIIHLAKKDILKLIMESYRIEYQNKRLASDQYKSAKKNNVKIKIKKRIKND